MRYISVDVETTGLDPEFCGLLQVAMVAEDTEKDDPVELLRSVVVLFDPGPANWEDVAHAMHAKSGLLQSLREACEKDPQLEKHSMMALNAFLDAAKGAGWPEPFVPAGKNFAGFDKRFLPVSIADRFDYRAIDPGSVFVDWSKPRLPGLKELGGRQCHTALEDAQDVIRVLRRSYAR